MVFTWLISAFNSLSVQHFTDKQPVLHQANSSALFKPGQQLTPSGPTLFPGLFAGGREEKGGIWADNPSPSPRQWEQSSSAAGPLDGAAAQRSGHPPAQWEMES